MIDKPEMVRPAWRDLSVFAKRAHLMADHRLRVGVVENPLAVLGVVTADLIRHETVDVEEIVV